MVLDYDKFIIDSIDMISGFNPETGECTFILDEIKDGTMDNAGEKVYGTGKNGRRIAALNRNKTCTFSCNNGFVVGGALAAQIGQDVEETEKSILVPVMETLKVEKSSDSTDTLIVKTSHTAVGTNGKEISALYKAKKDKTPGEQIEQAAEASKAAFSYATSTNVITLPTEGFQAGDLVLVSYEYETTGRKFVNSTDAFPKNCRIVMDIILRDPCNNSSVMHSKLVVPNAAIDPSYSMTFGNEPVVHSFGFESITDVCSADNELWYWIFPED